MNDLATTMAIRDDVFRQDSNLKIAKMEGMFLNALVELPCSQTSHPVLQALAEGIKP
jgi:hypothetical protein